MQDQPPWLQDPDEVRRRITEAGSVRRLAALTGVAKSTIHARSKAPPTRQSPARAQQPRTTITDDSLEVVSQKRRIVEHLEPVDLIRSAGADPEEWSWTFKRNVWEGPIAEGQVETFHQLTVNARRITPIDHVLPARCCDKRHQPTRARRRSTRQPIIVALAADQHAPHVDTGLHSCWLAWVADHQPSRIIGLGDLGNYSKPSKHRGNLDNRFNDDPNECGQGGHDWWRDTINAHGNNPECDQLPGNHDMRLGIAALERLPDAYNTRRPGEEYPWHDPEYLYSLDKLGVAYHRPSGEYFASEIEIAPGLSVTHGTTHGPSGGAHKAVAAKHEGSRAIGHDHKQALTHVVRYRDKQPHIHVAVSVGTMAIRNLGYTPDPDIQQGFAIATIWPDGYWNIELARYDDRRRTLVYRDQRYEAA